MCVHVCIHERLLACKCIRCSGDVEVSAAGADAASDAAKCMYIIAMPLTYYRLSTLTQPLCNIALRLCVIVCVCIRRIAADGAAAACVCQRVCA